MSFIAPAPQPTEDALPHHPFFPAIQPADCRAVMEFDGTITASRLAHALTEAVIDTNRELRAWRIRHEAAGHATLTDVPDDEPGRLPYLYKRAIYSKAKADLMERMLNFDATAAGQKKAESQEPVIDDHRRNARWAIRDILGLPRTTTELI